jgi:hypothetical protein
VFKNSELCVDIQISLTLLKSLKFEILKLGTTLYYTTELISHEAYSWLLVLAENMKPPPGTEHMHIAVNEGRVVRYHQHLHLSEVCSK